MLLSARACRTAARTLSASLLLAGLSRTATASAAGRQAASPAQHAGPPQKAVSPTSDEFPSLPSPDEPLPAQSPPQKKGVPLTVRSFKSLYWNPGEDRAVSPATVQIEYTQPKDGKVTTITAGSLDYNGATDSLVGAGGVTVERPEGVLSGTSMKYSISSETGNFDNAAAVTDTFRMQGKRIERRANGDYVVTDGVFTTCLRVHPDYRIAAKRFTISPNEYVAAKSITFYADDKPLFWWPSFKRDLRTQAGVPVPLPSYNSVEGFTLRFADTPVVRPHESVAYDLRIGAREAPVGFAALQQDVTHTNAQGLPPRAILPFLENPLIGFLDELTPPTYREYNESRIIQETQPRTTAYAVLASDQFVYNRSRTDLQLFRLPEFGIRAVDILGRHAPQEQAPAGTPPERVVGSTEGVVRRVPFAPFLLDVDAAAGEIVEEPTKASAGRFSLRTSASSQPILIGRRLSWRIALSNWSNLYSTGTAYDLLSPEADLNYVPTRTSLLGVGYRYMTDVGTTPFVFDRRDVRHEMRFQYQVGGPWAFGVVSRLDLERTRFYDAEFAVLRNFDCMQVGLAYRRRSQSINILFNILPPVPNRAERRRRPLPPGG